MIVTRLQGGLGNQMFQYAFGKALAIQLNTPLYLDASAFSLASTNIDITPRAYELGVFSTQNLLWPNRANSIFFPSQNIVDKIWHQIKRRLGINALLYEQKLGYDSTIFGKAKKNSYLVGYWQSHHYFSAYRNELLSDFNFNLSVIQHFPYLQKIQREVAISIHIRRGDYANNQQVQSVHGLLPMTYYQSAVQEMEQQVSGDKTWFVFSDDLAWCKVAFEWLDSVVFCETEAMPIWYDMFLMSKCKHHIIANSSYSWWGAWLATYKKQFVIAPAQWFVSLPSATLQMHPPEWCLI